MSKKIKYLLIVFLIILINNIYIINNKDKKIYKILNSESYSYLPKEAKEYIKNVYENTGEVILTEKNKEENTPYLNPQYINYLKLSDEKKKNISIIPNIYSSDYVYTGENINDEYPLSYNLENVNGNNYTSPMYDQGSLGTCWAFAMVENAESYLMVKNNEPRNENSQKFSVRQLDYASSTNGINNYNNPYGIFELTKGGNFVYGAMLMANGLSLVSDDYMPYNYSLDKKELYQIHNYNNSIYELNSAIELPKFGVNSSIFLDTCMDADDELACIEEKENNLFKEYINVIKSGITNYGGIYLGSNDPTGQCGAINTDDKWVLTPSSVCFPMGDTASVETGHAMQIIGWDDNYQYSYCSSTKKNSSVVNGKCSSGTLKQGTGAWLVKNSWGENEKASYIYLTYDSIKSGFVTFAYSTSLTKMADRTWDNTYNNGKIKSVLKVLDQTFEKKFNNTEKIEKIKFYSLLMNQEYSIVIKNGENTYLINDSFQVKYPGLHEVDISDKNILVKDEAIEVIITNKNNKKSLYDSISVFTKNIDNTKLIITEEEKNVETNFTIYSETRNIPSNAKITYELYSMDDVLIDDALEVKNNIVAANNVNTQIYIKKKLNSGKYKLVQKNDDAKAITYLNIDKKLDGAGTLDSPYKIYTEEDLKYISNNLDAYYELENDITITDNWIPIGTKENPFTGAFDGKNNKIINLKIDDSTLEYAGLFGYIKDTNSHKTYIKNIYLYNPIINAKEYVSALIGGININNKDDLTTLIDSIYIIGGDISGNYASSLIADISGYESLTINNIFSSAKINGKSSSSIIRFSKTNYNSQKTSITNIENIGIMIDNDNTKTNYTTSIINANYPYYYKIDNYISTGYSKKNAILNQYYDTPINNTEYNYYSNGYVLKRSKSTYTFPTLIESNSVYDITLLKDEKFYSNWEEYFSSNWVINKINNINRIPLLKNVDLDYVNCVDNINIEIGNDILLSNYISNIQNSRIVFTIKDSSIIKITSKSNSSEPYPYEVVLTPLKVGTTTLHVISDYDGFEKDIIINVTNSKINITYHNDNITKIQEINSGIDINLSKNTFTKEGYIFNDWNTKIDGNGTFYKDEELVNLKENLDLYAQWKPISYKIKYYLDHKKEILKEQELIYDKKENLLKNTFIKEGYTFTGWNTKSDGSGTSYKDEQIIINLTNIENNVIELYAQWEPTFDIKINNYEVDEINKYISKITVNTTLNTFKSNITLASGYTLDVDYKLINNKEVLYTRGKTKINYGLNIYREYTNVVIGDINGDGNINSADLLKIRQHLLKINILNGAYFLSSDINYDNVINSADLLKIRQHLLGINIIK